MNIHIMIRQTEKGDPIVLFPRQPGSRTACKCLYHGHWAQATIPAVLKETRPIEGSRQPTVCTMVQKWVGTENTVILKTRYTQRDTDERCKKIARTEKTI